jgi:hypothetical protein
LAARSIACSGVMFVFERQWDSLIETTTSTPSASASIALPAPFSFGTRAV